MGAFTGIGVNTRTRWRLPCPRETPTLVVADGGSLVIVAPWPKRERPTPLQAAAFVAARNRVVAAGRAGAMPPVAWVTNAAIEAVPGPIDPAWIQRRLHDGHVVRLPLSGGRRGRSAINDRCPVSSADVAFLARLMG